MTPLLDRKKLDLKGFILVELVVVIASGGGFFVFKKVQEEVKPIRILVMWTMMRTMMQIAPLMKMIMNLCKQDRLDAWGNLWIAFT